MKPSMILAACAASQAAAHPGMGNVMAEIAARTDPKVDARLADLISDLQGRVTKVGNTIRQTLDGASAQSSKGGYKPPGDLGSKKCSRDACCAFYYVAQDMSATFTQGTDGQSCNAAARGAIRLGFHDAATWDKDSPYGGADGSLLLAPEEMSRRENNGLQAIADQTRAWYNKYRAFGVGMADLIQLGANTAAVSCPGGPRIRTYVGRRDDSRAGPTGKLPSPFQSADALIDLFKAKTFKTSELIALMGAHSTSQQFFVDPSRAGASQDTTPGRMDVRYYSETLTNNNRSSVLVFPSDRNLALDDDTRGAWNRYRNDQNGWAEVRLTRAHPFLDRQPLSPLALPLSSLFSSPFRTKFLATKYSMTNPPRTGLRFGLLPHEHARRQQEERPDRLHRNPAGRPASLSEKCGGGPHPLLLGHYVRRQSVV